MEFGQLEAFIMAANEGSFSRAAEVLQLAQPSVSARIAALEKAVGGPVFVRGGRELTLTTLGETLLPHAERVIGAMTEARESVERYHTGQVGVLTILSLDTPGIHMLPDPLANFRKLYPSVDIRVSFRYATSIFAHLRTRAKAIGLVGTRVYAKDVRVLARTVQPVLPVAAPTHPLAIKQAESGPLEVSDLMEHTLYRVTLNQGASAAIENLAEAARSGSGGAVVHVPTSLVVGQIIYGHGIAFLPELTVMRHINEGNLVFLDIPEIKMEDELLLIAHAERELDPPDEAFVKLFRERWQHLLVE